MTLSHMERNEENEGGMRVKIKTMGRGQMGGGRLKPKVESRYLKRRLVKKEKKKIESKEEIFKS